MPLLTPLRKRAGIVLGHGLNIYTHVLVTQKNSSS